MPRWVKIFRKLIYAGFTVLSLVGLFTYEYGMAIFCEVAAIGMLVQDIHYRTVKEDE